MKRNIEIEDTLQERVQSAIEEVKEALIGFLDSNPDTEACPCLNNDLDYSGAIHEIVDGAVPIYTYEIKATWFLHDSDLEEAYENSGIGNNPRENDGMAAIYCYIQAKVSEWYDSEAQGIFEDWQEKRSSDAPTPPSHAVTAITRTNQSKPR